MRQLPWIASALLLAAACGAQTEVDRRVDLPGNGTVEISLVSGSVAVTGWDREEVEITGTLGREVEDLVIERRGQRLEIEVELPRRTHGRNAEAHLEIRVPRTATVQIEAVSAEMTALDLAGDLEAETVSGSVRVEGNSRKIVAESVSGDIEIRAAAQDVAAESVSGNIDLTGVSGDVEAETVSGKIRIRDAVEVRRLDLESVSGNIELDGRLTGKADAKLSSHSGNVELRIPRSTSARFEVQTFSGDIDNDLGPQAERVDRYTPEKRLSFALGGGDARISIETFSGDIDIRER